MSLSRLRREDDVRSVVVGMGTVMADAGARAYAQVVDRALQPSQRITSAAEGRAVLESDDHSEAFAEQLQMIAIVVTPLIRTLRLTRRFAKVPTVLIASTVLATVMTIRRGVRELQILAALVEHRIETDTGRRPDAELVKATTLALYLDPGRVPEPRSGGRQFARVARRWAIRGAFGRDTGHSAARALDAAERLDAGTLVARWAGSAARAG
jgi:hypothetical protein